MRLFLREQAPLLLIYLLQLIVVTFVYWLDGYRHWAVSLYASLLSGSLLAVYLLYRFISNRTFYARLEEPLTAAESFSGSTQQTPLAESLQHLLKSQFRLYQSDLLHYKHRIEDHIQFINQWVHQMKTPLSVIHLLLQNDDDPKSRAIGDELDRLKKGLETVLYTARLDSFERDFYVETLSLEEVVRRAASSQKRLFIRSGVFPLIQIDRNLTIASDEKWLSFMLTQLITNAVRYSASIKDDKDRKIYFRGYRQGAHTALEIADEGIGIPASDQARVFDAYFTGENGRLHEESTGMGLFLVKQICDKLGHAVELESEPGVGTTVRIKLTTV